MDKVTLNKNDLLKKVSANREAHQKMYQEALEGYRKEVAETLTKQLAVANQNKDVDLTELYQLAKPALHLKEYDRVINMLSHHQGNTVDLSNRDFGRFFEDDWEWKEQWLTSNSKYTMAMMK